MMPWIRKREGILSIILVPSLTFPTPSISQFPLPHLLIIPSMIGNTNSEFGYGGYDGYDYWIEKIDTPWCHGSFSHSQNERLSCAIQIILHPSPSIHHFLPLLLFFSILPHPIVSILFTDQNLTFDTPITFLHFSKLIISYSYPTSLATGSISRLSSLIIISHHENRLSNRPLFLLLPVILLIPL